MRKIALVVAVAVALYAVIGFLIAPLVLKPLLITSIGDHLGRKATVEKIKFNPFVLSLSLQEFAMSDSDGELFVGFDEFFCNMQLSSLFRRAYTFHTIRLLRPTGYVRIFSDGNMNFSDLLLSSETSHEHSDGKKTIPSLIIYHLDIDEGLLGFSDYSRPTAFESILSPIQITLKDFSTSRDSESPYAFTASTGKGEAFHWEGNIAVNPFRSSGKIALTGIEARGLWEYIQDSVQFEIENGKIALTSQYEIGVAEEGVLVRMFEADLDLAAFELVEKDSGTTLIELPVFSIEGAVIDFTEKELSAKRIATSDGTVAGWVTPEGRFNFQDLFAANPSSSEDEEASLSTEPGKVDGRLWRIVADEVIIENYAGMLENRTLDEWVRLDFFAIHGTGKNVSNEKDSNAEVTISLEVGDTGAINAEGTVGIDPFGSRVRVKVSGLDLTPAKAYLASVSNLDLINGVGWLDGTITCNDPGSAGPRLRYEGRIGVDDFRVDDTAFYRRLLSWEGLSCNGMTLDVAPNSLHIADIVLQGPYARVIIDPDMTLNISKAVSPPDDRGSDDEVFVIESHREKIADHGPMMVTVDAFQVEDGSMDFSDLSLTPNFAAGIHELRGSINGLSSQPSSLAEVLLEGRVNKYAPVKFAGQINLLSPATYADLALSFKNVELTTLTPYSGKFAGYIIEKGKLSLDLTYKLKDEVLIGENTLMLDQLTLGDQVNSSDATTLPVRLAVALLRDRHGRIDVDLPVRGDLNDPEFSVGRLIGKALVNLITKIVASPFSTLARLAGLDAESLSVVSFDCGTSKLEPKHVKNLDALSQALLERPALRLEIKGTAVKDCDGSALAEEMLLHVLNRTKYEKLSANGVYNQESVKEMILSDEEYNHLILETYKTTFGDNPEVLFKTSEEDPLPEAIIAAARERLLENMVVDELSFRRLARDRAESVKGYLLEEGGIPAKRLFLVEVAISDDSASETVDTLLSLTGH